MEVVKDGKTYDVVELQNAWRVFRIVGGASIEYRIEKELAGCYEELEKYIIENNELF